MVNRRQAWTVTGILVFCLLLWALWAYHDAYVKEYRSKKSADSTACPFKASESVKKEGECCKNKASENVKVSEKSKDSENTKASNAKTTSNNTKASAKSAKYAKLANPDGDVDSELSKFNGVPPEQLSQCPYHARLQLKKAEKK